MKLGFIGLGRMGKAMVLHLLEKGVDVVVFNRSSEKTKELLEKGAKSHPAHDAGSSKAKLLIRTAKGSARSLASARDDTFCNGKLAPTYNLSDFVHNLSTHRVIWLMVEHGKPVDEMINKLLEAGVTKGDIIIDGGNTFYKDSIRRYNSLKEKGIHYLDVGTSGGLEGARNGACLMVGGDLSIYNRVRPCFEAAACPGGYAYFGPAGAGHFVKMVHNGVEYGMLQAIGEGFEMLERGMPVTTPFARGTLAKTVKLDLHKVASNWIHGSVVRGWLMELLERALKNDPNLEKIEGVVGGGSTGEWTVATAKELKVETPVIEQSLEARKKSLDKPTFSGKVVAALRREFGGHEIKKSRTSRKK